VSLTFSGRARRLGDAINTDYIIASSRKRETLDPHILKRWLLESVDPDFAASVEPGDIFVAGDRFGTGSAMEVAVTVVLACGTYYRNALNNGLVPVEMDTSGVREGDALLVEIDILGVRVTNQTRGGVLPGVPFSDFALMLLAEGGIVSLLARRGDFAAADSETSS
jgi:3-isopropylmalate/(R)-2-methylmalate dehydratase small subunit